MNQICNLLGSLRLLGRQGLESLVGGRTMEDLFEGTRGKEIVRRIVVEVRGKVEGGIGEVDLGEDSF